MKTFTGEDIPALRIIMDSCRYSEKPEDHLPLENKILETVLALSYFLAGHHIPVSVCTYNEKYVRMNVNGTEGFEDFYNAMAGFSFSRMKLPRNAHLLSIYFMSGVMLPGFFPKG